MVTIPFTSPNKLTVYNVRGVPKNGEIVQLFKSYTIDGQTAGENIGSARAYGFNLKDIEYKNDSTKWDLHLYDIQTKTDLILNRTLTASEVPLSSLIVGKSSGAIGFSISNGTPGGVLSVRQTSGKFIKNEILEINGVEFPVGVGTVNSFGVEDIKSIGQSGITDFPQFFARTVLQKSPLPNGVNEIYVGHTGIATATNVANGSFTGIKTDSIIRYNLSLIHI